MHRTLLSPFLMGRGQSFPLCVILSQVTRFAISSCQEKRFEMSIIKNPNYSILVDSHYFIGQYSPVSIPWLSPGEDLL